jgi:hypothetical protein
MTSNPIAFIALCLCALLSGCIGFGPRSLKSDQVDYARALGDAKKREILSVIVGLRYADAPAFLNVSQIIAAYTFDATGVGLLNVGPIPGGPRAQVTDTVSYSNHPTFTFIPTTGRLLSANVKDHCRLFCFLYTSAVCCRRSTTRRLGTLDPASAAFLMVRRNAN